MNKLLTYLIIIIVAVGCGDKSKTNEHHIEPIPKTVEIYWGDSFMSLERYDRDKNLIEKIGATLL